MRTFRTYCIFFLETLWDILRDLVQERAELKDDLFVDIRAGGRPLHSICRGFKSSIIDLLRGRPSRFICRGFRSSVIDLLRVRPSRFICRGFRSSVIDLLRVRPSRFICRGFSSSVIDLLSKLLLEKPAKCQIACKSNSK